MFEDFWCWQLLTCRIFHKPADGVSVVVDLASGAWAAGGWVAGVGLLNASLVLANKAALAVRIPHTLGAASSDGVWFGDQALLAPAKSPPLSALALSIGRGGAKVTHLQIGLPKLLTMQVV